VLKLGYFLEIRHRDVICTHFTVNHTMDRCLSTHATWNCEYKGLLFSTVN